SRRDLRWQALSPCRRMPSRALPCSRVAAAPCPVARSPPPAADRRSDRGGLTVSSPPVARCALGAAQRGSAVPRSAGVDEAAAWLVPRAEMQWEPGMQPKAPCVCSPENCHRVAADRFARRQRRGRLPEQFVILAQHCIRALRNERSYLRAEKPRGHMAESSVLSLV